MIITYPSKVSYGLLAIVSLAFLGPIALVVVSEEFNWKVLVLLLFLALVFALSAHMLLATSYTIHHNQLKIKCGIFWFKPVPINEITEISKTNSIASAPAASLDRIAIKYGKFKELIISPKDKFHFAQALLKVNPGIKNNLKE